MIYPLFIQTKKDEIKMIYTSEMILPEKEKNSRYFFLAGSMDLQLEKPWRQSLIKELPESIHVFDPTCMNHGSLNEEEMRKHIQWELDAMELADRILLNFLPNASSPISMVEMGLYTMTDKLIVVCPKEFHSYRYIKQLCKNYTTPFFEDLGKAKTMLKSF